MFEPSDVPMTTGVTYPAGWTIAVAWRISATGGTELTYLLGVELRCTATDPETCDSDHKGILSFSAEQFRQLRATIVSALNAPLPPAPLNPN